MDRRGVAGTICATLVAVGAPAMISALTLAYEQPYRDIIFISGLVATVVGIGGLIGLFLFPGKRPEAENPPVPIPGRFETASPLQPPTFVPQAGSFTGIIHSGDHGVFRDVEMHNLDIGMHLSGTGHHIEGVRISADRPIVFGPKKKPQSDSEKEG